MYVFRDLSRLTRGATIALWIFMPLLLLYGILDYLQNVMRVPSLNETAVGLPEIVGLLSFFCMLICLIVIGMWIYRASANAHTIAPDLTIKAGWAVGWYFIPVANLFKPFQAMKEIWLASRFGLNWQSQEAPGRLTAWWALWLFFSFAGNASGQLASRMAGPSAVLNLLQGVVAVPLSFILIQLMRDIAANQDATRNQGVFA
ncbi:DUF4328 domain-containing protein [Sphingomonas sp.]|uniref:DUF4328 domain-containing protein n=1 Tax=Sphingomonas sp. TaxID=28214 RepID=UPI003B3A41B1